VPASSGSCALLLVLLWPVSGLSQQAPAKASASATSPETLFVNCQEMEETKHVFGPVFSSHDRTMRAYVEVEVQRGCIYTSRLWVAGRDATYRPVFLMAPRPSALGNGMEILGWARTSSMLLLETEEWQEGSDAPDTQGVLAIDARTGLVQEMRLQAMLQLRKDRQCSLRVTDAGYSADRNVTILVRAKFSTAFEVDETEEDVAPAKRCGNFEETWSFDLYTGKTQRVADAQPLLLWRKILPNRRKQ